MKAKKSINLSHHKQAIEILSIVFASKRYITKDEILEKYANLNPEKIKGEKLVARCINTIHEMLGEEIIESRTNKGYKLKEEYSKNFFWMLPLFSRYLAITEQESLNYIFEPIVFQLEASSLLNLFLLELARTQRRQIQFDYIKYKQKKTERKRIEVYAIIQRDKKLLVMGNDCITQTKKHYFFTGIQNLKLLETDFEKANPDVIKIYYRDSIGIYKGNEKLLVRIRFSLDADFFIYKEYFHRDQKIIKDAKGFILELMAFDKQEIFNIVSQFMKYAELLEPKEWREEFRLDIEKFYKRHKKSN